jgi:erythrocyte band 7 integral membrane protein
VTITVDAVCYFRIFNPVVSVISVQNAGFSTRLLAATTLRNILGTKTLQEILREKDAISHQMQELLGIYY